MKLSTFITIERGGANIEVEAIGDVSGPEYDVGIMGPQVEGIHCNDLESAQFGAPQVEFTPEEEERVSEILAKKYFEEASDDFDR